MLHLLLLAIVAAVPQEKLDRSKHPWAKWKIGAYTKYKIVQQAGENKAEGTGTSTLTKVTDDEYVTTTKYDFGEQKIEEEETETIPVKDGEETLTVEGKKYECTIWKSTSTKGEKKTEYRVWATKKDARLLKVVGKGGSDLDITAAAMSESVEVAGKKYDCVRLEGSVKEEGRDGKAVFWMTEGIPGGLVKMEAKYAGEPELTVQLEMTEFKAEK